VVGAAGAQMADAPARLHHDTLACGGAVAASASSPDSVVALFGVSPPRPTIAAGVAPAPVASSAEHAGIDRWARWRPRAEPRAEPLALSLREAAGATLLPRLRTCARSCVDETPRAAAQRTRTAHPSWWTMYSPVPRPSSSGAASEPARASHSLRSASGTVPGPAPFSTSATTRSKVAPSSVRGGEHARRSRSTAQTLGREAGDLSKSLDASFRQTVAAHGARAAPAERLLSPIGAFVLLQRTACWLAVRTVARALAGRIVAAAAPSSTRGAVDATKLFGSRVGGVTSAALSSWQSLSAVVLVEFVAYPIDTVGFPPRTLFPSRTLFSRSPMPRSPELRLHTIACCSWPRHRRPLHLMQWRRRAMAFGTPPAEVAASEASASRPSRASRLGLALTTLSSLWDGWCWHMCIELLVGRAVQKIARMASTLVAAEIMWPQWRALLRGIVTRSWSDARQQVRTIGDGALFRTVKQWTSRLITRRRM
jgi:hypothetical protein